jgi:predicted AAA+ superfamily ATPase
VVNDLHKQASELSVPPNLYHWRTSAGAEVDLILERDSLLYPIEIKCKTNPTRADISGIKAFKATYPNQKIMPGLVIHAGSERYLLDADTIAIPWHFNPARF